MSNGKSWSAGYRPGRYTVEGHHACPNGKAKCWVCGRPDLVAYKAEVRSPISDGWDLGEDE